MDQTKKITHNFKGIVDSTLREGFQFLKANFKEEEQHKIFDFLMTLGVDYIELSNPANCEIKRITKILIEKKNKNQSKAKIVTHVRNRLEDLKNAYDVGVDGVNILCTADTKRLASMNSNLDLHLKILKENILFAKENQLEIRVSVEDSFNQPIKNIIEIYKLAASNKVNKIGIADTLGRAMSWKIAKLVKEFKKEFKTDIEIHFHNDLGQAVSNAVNALSNGANWVDTTLLGIGERTGIIPLSLFLANLYVINPNLTKKYNLKKLTEAENYIANICQMETPFNLITNKFNGFAHKAGVHLDALIKHGPKKYELFSPDIIGNKRTLVCNTVISGRTTDQDIKKFYKLYGQ